MARREWGEFRVDDTPTQNSKNPVESGGVYSAIESLKFTVLPIDKGGTGKTTAQEAADNFLYSLAQGSSQILNDNLFFISGSLNDQTPTRFYKRTISTLCNYIKGKLLGDTVNVNRSDLNTDTSSFAFVNGHVYHLTAWLRGSGFSINTSSSGRGSIIAYIGSSASNNHYSCMQMVNIQQGVITTDDIRLHVDWKAENIEGSRDNKLHIKVMFNGTEYSLVQSNFDLVLVGTDFSGA